MTIPVPRTAGIDAKSLDQAADWLMRLHHGDATDADRQACRQWQNASADNARAWARAEALMNKLGGLPPALALPVLQRPSSRRAAVAKLACLLAAAPAAWLGWRGYSHGNWSADHHTATGRRQDIRLADGTRITLNTASAIDVRFDAQRRLVRLRSGEIMIATAADSAALARPFYVETAEGLLQALGTRFSVRQEDGRSRLAVFEHAVRIEPRRVPAAGWLTVDAGNKASFSADAIEAPQPAGPADDAWTHGMLLADGMRLGDFSAELGRYLPSLLRCDPAVANLRISGAFPLDHPERILSMLVSTYPVQALRRFGGYWVTLAPLS
jgi:transmembrane sensor